MVSKTGENYVTFRGGREGDYSFLLTLARSFQLNNTDNWMRLKSCLVKSDDCNDLSKRYKVLVSSSADSCYRLFDFSNNLSLSLFFKSFCLTISDSQAVQVSKADANRSRLLQTSIWVSVTFKFLLFFFHFYNCDKGKKKLNVNLWPFQYGQRLTFCSLQFLMKWITIYRCEFDFVSDNVSKMANSRQWYYLSGVLIRLTDVVILLLMHHTMTWVFILLIQTMTANYTRIPGQSSVTIVILASKYQVTLFFHSPSTLLHPRGNLHAHFIVWSFRAGVAQYMKIEWRLVAIFNVILFVVLVRTLSIVKRPLWNPHWFRKKRWKFVYHYMVLTTISMYVLFFLLFFQVFSNFFSLLVLGLIFVSFNSYLDFHFQLIIYLVGCCARRNAARNRSKG